MTEHTGARYGNPHKVHRHPSALVSHPSLTVPSDRLYLGGKCEGTAVSRVVAGKTKRAGDSSECFTLLGWITKQRKKTEQPNWTLHRHV